MTKVNSRERLPVFAMLLLFLASLLFRLWLIYLVPQQFAFDQEEYEWYAYKMYNDSFLLASHSYRSYLYPLFLSLIYKMTFFGNHELIRYIQAVLDSLVSVFIFLIGSFGLKFGKWSWVGAVLYAFNPFTAGFVGVLLSESLATFFVGLTLLSGVMYFRTRQPHFALLFGFSAGCMGQVRNQILFLSLIPIGLCLLLLPWKNLKWHIVILFFGFFTTLIYPLFVNWRDYKVFTFTTIDNMTIRELYNGTVVGKMRVFRSTFPVEAQWMWAEYYSENHQELLNARQDLNKKYIRLFTDHITHDPAGYIQTRIEKMLFMWQKEAIYPYDEPGFYKHSFFTYLANFVLIIVAFYGLYRWNVARQDGVGLWVKRTIINILFISTVGFSLTNAEQRYTIPLYPMVFISAMVGLRSIVEHLQLKYHLFQVK